ncbi:hypothetical protein L933_08445 [Helicobacter pylori PZ5056]|uniref:Uncharacterized protein n=1 Tax=Helicobacter pylori PZ5056 TaxID=1337393 RepID=T2STI5_HELPX|nr:hypothetical protein L933_08445 [Helicobacter pylori PZ5056]
MSIKNKEMRSKIKALNEISPFLEKAFKPSI